MAIISKRNTHLTLAQIIVSLTVMAAMVILTLGNLVSIPTAKNPETEEHIDAFYENYPYLEDDALGDNVNLGCLKLWKEGLHSIIPTVVLLAQGDDLSHRESDDICMEEGFLLLTFLVKDAFVASVFEGIAFLALLLALMLLPLYITVYFLYALAYTIIHRHKRRDIFLRVSHCLSRVFWGIMMLGTVFFFNPSCSMGPTLAVLLWVSFALVVFHVVITHVKEHSRDRRHFLIYSQLFSLIATSTCTLSLWFAHRAGLMTAMYEKLTAMDGIEIFTELWEGELDSHAFLMFWLITAIIFCLTVAFVCLYHMMMRFLCIFNTREKRQHDRLFQYAAFLLLGLLMCLLLLNASKHHAIQLTSEAMFYYILSIVFAVLALLCEILYGVIGHFVIGVDMVTRLELLSGYVEDRLVMDEETLESALATEKTNE